MILTVLRIYKLHQSIKRFLLEDATTVDTTKPWNCNIEIGLMNLGKHFFLVECSNLMAGDDDKAPLNGDEDLEYRARLSAHCLRAKTNDSSSSFDLKCHNIEESVRWKKITATSIYPRKNWYNRIPSWRFMLITRLSY
jgi:hypothetical protein